MHILDSFFSGDSCFFDNSYFVWDHWLDLFASDDPSDLLYVKQFDHDMELKNYGS